MDNSPEEMQRLQRLNQHVLELLMKSGWIQQTAFNKEKFAVLWTPHGLTAAKQLKTLIYELTPELTGEELGMLIAILEDVGPPV
jgi:hypothetical protein